MYTLSLSASPYSLSGKLQESRNKRYLTCLTNMVLSYPESHRPIIEQGLSSADDRQFIGTYTDLWVHTWLANQGFEIQCLDRRGNRSQGPKTPEFLISWKGNPVAYVECTAVCWDNDWNSRERRAIRKIW